MHTIPSLKKIRQGQRKIDIVSIKDKMCTGYIFLFSEKKLIWNADKTRCTCSNFYANVGILEVTFMLEYGINKYISITYEDSLSRVSSSAKLNPW